MGYPSKSAGFTVANTEWNEVANQGIMRFADATARDAAITSPIQGQRCFLTSTDRECFYDGSGWVDTPAGASAYESTATSFATGVASNVPQSSLIYENGNYWDAGANQRMTVPSNHGGYFIVTAGMEWQANATGFRQLAIRKNGVAAPYLAIQTSNNQGASNTVGVNLSWIGVLVGGDYVEGVCLQNSGGNLAQVAGSSYLSIARLSD